ncbi:CynX/NimT family MFS transporter [Streptomyces sp. NBC_00878]|uniref:MFS transporter n=1 Tax=Streptomyces sp. NBC_00878 TaxID=2975854 RepID=UPI002258835B|nr:MFS transporter [Streptomyces sp. NBC_00878]MCX4910933.1 MFS transporter [Streptomyces sp. NBC_00878]
MALKTHPTGTGSAWIVVVAAGVAAGLQVWKLPPALPFLRHDLSLTLVQAGTLLGIVQLAGMLGGLAVSLLAELIGERRCLIGGLVLLFLGSAGGGFAWSAAPLLASRAVEGAGFILAVVTGPGLIRRSTPPGRFTKAMGFWGAYQGIATFAGLITGALVLQAVPWRVWWWAMAVLALAPLPWILARVPLDDAGGTGGGAATVTRTTLARTAISRVGRTVRAPAPWTAGLVFACYTLQWMAVVGFLPTIYQDGGMTGSWPGVLSAVVGAANAIGSIANAALMKRGLPARALLIPAFTLMATTSLSAFAVHWHTVPGGTAWQFLCVVAFSLTGGAIPATLLRMIGDLTPTGGSAPATMGLVQQLFNVGSFVGPTLAAWLATRTGGWHSTWWLTCACAAAGIVLTLRLRPEPSRSGTQDRDLRGTAS